MALLAFMPYVNTQFLFSFVSFFLQIDIFYTMSIVGTLSFPGEDMDVNNDTSHFFEAISEIQPTVFFGPPSAFERIYHHFREMKKHTSGTYINKYCPYKSAILLEYSSLYLKYKTLVEKPLCLILNMQQIELSHPELKLRLLILNCMEEN